MVRKERHQTVRVAVLYQQEVLAVVNIGLYGDYRRIASGEAGVFVLNVKVAADIQTVVYSLLGSCLLYTSPSPRD